MHANSSFRGFTILEASNLLPVHEHNDSHANDVSGDSCCCHVADQSQVVVAEVLVMCKDVDGVDRLCIDAVPMYVWFIQQVHNCIGAVAACTKSVGHC